MTAEAGLSADAIRRARIDNPKMRERDLASQLGISEAELMAAHCGKGVARIEPRVHDILAEIGGLGEVMALTRNESAVHEKIGVYEKVSGGTRNAVVLGPDIDLRIFGAAWKHGFAVEKDDGEEVRRSLQFFDEAGKAVHKVHLRPESDVAAYERLVHSLISDDQSDQLDVENGTETGPESRGHEEADAESLRTQWSSMTDVHQFHGILRKLKLSRYRAVGMVGEDYAWRVDDGAVPVLFGHAAQEQIPIMVFVGNKGCIQIHSGPVETIKQMGPWLNVLDPTFHLHLRTDHISEAWVVRKPVREGHVTSLEAYDANGTMIVQFFGKRNEGEDERQDWRSFAESLPRIEAANVA